MNAVIAKTGKFFLIALLCLMGSGAAFAQPLQPAQMPPSSVEAAQPPALSAAPAPAPVATPSGTDTKISAGTLSDGYVLGPGDVLEVSMVGRGEYQARVQVQVDGTVQLPFLRTIPAVNMTLLQLRQDIERRLKDGGYYTDPVIAINVVSFASRYVVVLGAVGSPGLVPIDRAYRVSEIMARVGGPRENGSDELTIRRESGEELTLNLLDVATGGEDLDPYVKAGDKLFVAPAKTYYIYGAIAGPGNYKIERDMSLRKALARSGGLTPLGSEKRIKIYRGGKEIRGFAPDQLVEDGDVIVVGEKFF